MRLRRETDESMTWSEFTELMAGLLAADTRIARHFAPTQPEGGS